MGENEKKAYMLLKSVIFHYHGLDEDEIANLNETADEINAHKELKWAEDFITSDHLSAFDRAREYLNEIIGDFPKAKRIEYIHLVWKANMLKGFITEMEATAMLKFAQDWKVQDELIALVKKQ